APLPGAAGLCGDAVALADPAVREPLQRAAAAVCSALGLRYAPPRRLTADALAAWVDAYIALQYAEIEETLGGWIAAARPCFGANIAPRFASIAGISAAARAAAAATRAAARTVLDDVLRETLLILPTAPFAPPPRDIDESDLGRLYPRMLALGAPASLGGLPQVTLPLAATADGPIGLSLLGPRGSDRALLAAAAALPSLSGDLQNPA
ncbi:MAG: amidase family protein, partial [Acetobacteraceae bacterium]